MDIDKPFSLTMNQFNEPENKKKSFITSGNKDKLDAHLLFIATIKIHKNMFDAPIKIMVKISSASIIHSFIDSTFEDFVFSLHLL